MTESDWNSDRNMVYRYLPERTAIPKSGSDYRLKQTEWMKMWEETELEILIDRGR